MEEVMDLADRLNRLLVSMTDEQRLEVRDKVMDGYCPLCGSDNLPCYCAPCYDE